jgi:hypothetical protein
MYEDDYYCSQCPYFLDYKFRQMNVDQARAYVRAYIMSDETNPTEPEFRAAMLTLSKQVRDQLAAYCDLLIANFIHTQGPGSPGVIVATKAKGIILSPKKK